MDMTANSCDYFLDVLASNAPTPGGGGAAALGGAIGMALSNMVGNLTVGKKKYAAVEDEVKALVEEGSRIIERLKELVDEDAEALPRWPRPTRCRKTPRRGRLQRRPWRNAPRWPLRAPGDHAPGLPWHQDPRAHGRDRLAAGHLRRGLRCGL